MSKCPRSLAPSHPPPHPSRPPPPPDPVPPDIALPAPRDVQRPVDQQPDAGLGQRRIEAHRMDVHHQRIGFRGARRAVEPVQILGPELAVPGQRGIAAVVGRLVRCRRPRRRGARRSGSASSGLKTQASVASTIAALSAAP